jgi:hypothetical protein
MKKTDPFVEALVSANAIALAQQVELAIAVEFMATNGHPHLSAIARAVGTAIQEGLHQFGGQDDARLVSEMATRLLEGPR